MHEDEEIGLDEPHSESESHDAEGSENWEHEDSEESSGEDLYEKLEALDQDLAESLLNGNDLNKIEQLFARRVKLRGETGAFRHLSESGDGSPLFLCAAREDAKNTFELIDWLISRGAKPNPDYLGLSFYNAIPFLAPAIYGRSEKVIKYFIDQKYVKPTPELLAIAVYLTALKTEGDRNKRIAMLKYFTQELKVHPLALCIDGKSILETLAMHKDLGGFRMYMAVIQDCQVDIRSHLLALVASAMNSNKEPSKAAQKTEEIVKIYLIASLLLNCPSFVCQITQIESNQTLLQYMFRELESHKPTAMCEHKIIMARSNFLAAIVRILYPTFFDEIAICDYRKPHYYSVRMTEDQANQALHKIQQADPTNSDAYSCYLRQDNFHGVKVALLELDFNTLEGILRRKVLFESERPAASGLLTAEKRRVAPEGELLEKEGDRELKYRK